MEKNNAKQYLLLLPINEIAKQFKVFSTWSVLKNRIVQLFQANKNLGYKLNAVTKINVKTHTEKHFIFKDSTAAYVLWIMCYVMDGFFYGFDAVMSFCCLSRQMENNCCLKLYGNYKNIKLVLHVKLSLKVNSDYIIIWKVYLADIWWDVKLHGKTFQDFILIQERSTQKCGFINNHIIHMKLIVNDGSLWAKSISTEVIVTLLLHCLP